MAERTLVAIGCTSWIVAAIILAADVLGRATVVAGHAAGQHHLHRNALEDATGYPIGYFYASMAFFLLGVLLLIAAARASSKKELIA